MLRLLVGPMKSGKTTAMMKFVKETVAANRPALLIVPEQFSFQTERLMLYELGERDAALVQVSGFSGLFHDMGRRYGGSAVRLLSDAEKIVMMNRTLDQLSDRLPLWKRYLHSPRFASKTVDMLGEFKLSGLTPDHLDEAAQGLPHGSLQAKLEHLSLIWRTYDALLGSRLLDPADETSRAALLIDEHRPFTQTAVFVDGFHAFTGSQYQLLTALLRQAPQVTITLLGDGGARTRFDTLNTCRTVLHYLESLAESMGQAVEKTVLTQTYYREPFMRRVGNLLLEKTEPAEDHSGRPVLIQCATPAEEARFAAHFIRETVRTRGLRYRDFAVIVRDTDAYKTVLEEACRVLEVPCFFDGRTPLSDAPLCRLVRYGLRLTREWSGEDLLGMLKTGLVDGFSPEQIESLENYTFLWNLNGSSWTKEWTMCTVGLDDRALQKLDVREDEEKRAELNRLRQKAIAPILTLRRDMRGSVRQMANAVFAFLEHCGTAGVMQTCLDGLSRDISAQQQDAFRQSWDLFCDVLDGLVACFGDQTLQPDDWCDTLELACRNTSVGQIPQRLDEVAFGSADRIQPGHPRYVLLLGANNGVFPALPSNNTLLGNAERQRLIDGGLPLKDRTVQQSVDEKLLVYKAACCADDGLVVTCHILDGAQPAAFFETLRKGFYADDPQKVFDTRLVVPETPEEALSFYCDDPTDDLCGSTLAKAIGENETFGPRLTRYRRLAQGTVGQLTPATARALYGAKLHLSPSRVNVYHKCPFQFFCRYGLGVEPKQPATLGANQRGTVIHYVLEALMRRHADDLTTLSLSDAHEEIDQLTEAYFARFAGFKDSMDASMRYMVACIKQCLYDVADQLIREFSQSAFRPVAFEMPIGDAKTGETVSFPYNGGRISLSGSIDRVDQYDRYLRIVDYKTGTVRLQLSEVVYGQSLQMLLYLYSLLRGEQGRFQSALPAGVLYMTAKPATGQAREACMTGLLLNEESVVRAMTDQPEKGEIIPKYDPAKRSDTYITGEEFETIMDHIERLMRDMGNALMRGEIPADPVDTADADEHHGNACRYCPFESICHQKYLPHRSIPNLTNAEVFEALKEGQSCNTKT